MKKKKEVRKRHLFIVTLAKILLTWYFKLKYKYSFKRHKELKKKGPFLVMGNHTVAVDPLLMALSFPFHLYHIATEQIFNLGFITKLLTFAVNPIKKVKTQNDISTIRKAKRIIKEGGSIGLFPEGNLTYDGKTCFIHQSTVKLIRFLQIPVIFLISEGLYFSNPRWSVYKKRGKTSSKLTKIIYPEEYNLLSDEKLYQIMLDELSVNAYQTNNTFLYKGKKIAHGLERLIFIDLKTNTPFTTYAKKDYLYSTTSDFTLKYLPSGYLLDQNEKSHTLVDLNEQVIKSYLKFYKSDEKLNYKTIIHLEKTVGNKKKSLGKKTLYLQKDKLIIQNKKNQESVMSFNDIISIAIQGKKKIIVYYENQTYLITFDLKTSPYAFLLTYQFYQEGGNIDDKNISLSKFGL